MKAIRHKRIGNFAFAIYIYIYYLLFIYFYYLRYLPIYNICRRRRVCNVNIGPIHL